MSDLRNLFGLSEQIWQTIDRIGILLGVAMGVTWFIGLVWAAVKPDSLRRWFTRNRFPSIGGSPEHTRWQGLIFTVSNPDVPKWVISKVRPKAIGLLTTDFSRNAGGIIRAEAERCGITVIKCDIGNPDDPAEVKRRAQELIQDMREQGIETVAVDITGGKAPMSVGAFMAAEESSIDTIYVTTEYKDNKPDMATVSIIAISQAGSH